MTEPIIIKLSNEHDGSNLNDSVEKMFKTIQDIRQTINNLRDQNTELEKTRDQYLIHFQQSQEDHTLLRNIEKRLRFRVKEYNQNFPNNSNLDSPATSSATSANPQIPEVNPFQIITSTVSAPHLDSFKSNIQITPESEGANPSSITLRYSLTTSTLLTSIQFSPDGKYVAFADNSFIYIITAEDGSSFCTITLPSTNKSPISMHRLRFSPDSHLLAFAAFPSHILLYEISSEPKLLRTLEGHSGQVTSLLFNDNGSWLFSGDSNGFLKVWDMKLYKEILSFQHPHEIIAIASGPSSDFIAVGFVNGLVGIYGSNFSEPVMTSFTAHHSRLTNLAVSPSTENIITTSEDGTVKVWTMRNVASCKATFSGHNDAPLTAIFGNGVIFTGSKDRTIKVWDEKNGKLRFTINPNNEAVYELCHHPELKTFASCSGDGTVCVWDYNDVI